MVTRRWLAALVVGLVGVCVLPMVGAHADPSRGSLMLVLDSSGSMKERVSGGVKIDLAKQALRSVVSKLPSDAPVGMRVYGATVFNKADKGACTDTQRVVDIGTDNRSELLAAIDRYKPYGETPIAYSLTKAADDLGLEGQRTIVLVSDGEETCNPDPCAVAKAIHDRGIDLKIDVVGLGVSGKARDQLSCIAKSGGGEYHDADDAGSLEDALSQLSSRAAKPFTMKGTPVKGSADADQAPAITPGVWTDTLPTDNTWRYYKINRSMADSTLWAGIVLQNVKAGAGGSQSTGLMLQFVAPSAMGETDCGIGTAWAWDANVKGSRAVGAGGVASDSQLEQECATADFLLLRIRLNYATGGGSGIPFALKIAEEPAVTNVNALPGPEESEPEAPDLKAGKSAAVDPGASFDGAPLITPGTYSFDGVAGEAQIFKVHADWGQSIQAEVLVPQLTQNDFVKVAGRAVSVKIVSPDYVAASADTLEPVLQDGTKVSTATNHIIWRNREVDTTDAAGASRPGDYYVLVLQRSAGAPQGPHTLALPMKLTIGVSGKAGDGTPDYRDVATGSAQPSGQPSSTPTEQPSNAASTAASQPSGTPVSTASTDQPDQSRGVSPLLVVGLVAGGVVLIGGGGSLLWLLRRRS